VSVVLEGGVEHPLNLEEGGYFSGEVAGIGAGALYRLRLDARPELLADPASRFQPEGPAGPSMVVDSQGFAWSDHQWQGVGAQGPVLYEMHIGTFTREGTWDAAMARLPMLRDLGITCLEIMPINEFEGSFGWGYDGTLLYAPTRVYGEPDDVRAFVDAAHRLGLGVILDVVYNHFGHGERFSDFTPDYYTDRHANDWGKSINFDGPNAHGVREYMVKNAAYWIDEYHFDGLRLDATQALFDDSDDHIVAQISREARKAGQGKTIYLVSENEPQETRMGRPSDKGGYGLDALWNDDFHHSASVALTGRCDGYYHDHKGLASEFVSAAKYGYLFQGQRHSWQNAPRGSSGFDLAPHNFVHFLQNHDQIANLGVGTRLGGRASPARVRAMTAIHLLGPQSPMLFQGQEFGATTPFYYFADREGEVADKVRKGRLESLGQFLNLTDEAVIARMPDPCARSTFDAVKLDWTEWDRHEPIVALHRDLLTMRRSHVAFAAQPSARAGKLDGSVLSTTAFLLRYFAVQPEDERLLIVNYGADLGIDSLPDPLFAPPAGHQWAVIWSSEDARYGGSGRRPYDFHKPWLLSADIALVLAPVAAEPREGSTGQELKRWQALLSFDPRT
jgi:maltooligosyltrehalose trehalohydrolase